MRDARIDKLAGVLVNYSVAVKRGDVVRISGATAAMPLARAVYREVLRAGGHPLLRLADDECIDIFYAQAGPKQLRPLRHRRAHQQPAVAAPLDRQPPGPRVLVEEGRVLLEFRTH